MSDLTRIVERFTTPTLSGKVVDLYKLDKSQEFKEAVKAQVEKLLQEIPHTCVLIPAGKARLSNPLRELIMELAMMAQLRTIVTGSPENLRKLLYGAPHDILLIKQSFKTGKGLQKDIADIREQGCNVKVLCLVAHSQAKLEKFAAENNIEATALVYLGE